MMKPSRHSKGWNTQADMLKSRLITCIAIYILASFAHRVLAEEGQLSLVPGDFIPFGFTMATIELDGSIGNFTLDLETKKGMPLIIHAYYPQDASLRYMWSSQNLENTIKFLNETPVETNFMFVSYSLDAVSDMKMMQDRLREALQADGKDAEAIKARLKRFKFARDPMSGISDQGANFVPYLMAEWQASNSIVKAVKPDGERLVIGRLDSNYNWLPWPAPREPLRVVPFGNGCTDRLPYDIQRGVALVVRQEDLCSYAEIISRAQSSNAAAVIVSAVEGESVDQMDCIGGECNLPLQIFPTMIPYDQAVILMDLALAHPGFSIAFGEESGPGYFAAVDGQGRLQQTGWIKFPTLQYVSWAAQWLEYQQNLETKLEWEALVVPIFESQIMQGEHGISKLVQLPHQEDLEEYDRLELDFELSCPGQVDADCPIWDHTIQLFVCCSGDDTCESCEATPWLSQYHQVDPAAKDWQAEWQSRNSSNVLKENCGRELGRWVTPFRRRIGRWLTDVTPLRTLLSSQQCHFTAQTAPWALPWKPSLRLRFLQSPQNGRENSKTTLVPLFNGGTFDKSYNVGRKNISAMTPQGVQKTLLYATITGHGSDEFNCAEFCPTSHHFLINEHEIMVNFTEAGTRWGCTKHVLDGVEPNEHGTWQYGRGGWCDGVNVPPHVFDVSEFVSKSGGNNTISYKGLFRGIDPDPKAQPGYIMMQSNLIFLHTNGVTSPQLD